MSIQTELTRITNAKAAIKAAIEGKGVTVPNGTLLDGMAALIESIQAGGGTTYGAYIPSEDLGMHDTYAVIRTGNTHASNGIFYCEDYNSLLSNNDTLFLAVVDGVAIGFTIYGNDGALVFRKSPSVNNGVFSLGSTYVACFLRASKKYVWVVW